MTFERWIDRPGRDVRAVTLTRPYAFASPFGGEPYVLLLVVVDPTVTTAERNAVCDAVVTSGCRYVCCAGRDAELWHDVLDETCVGDGESPVFLMTTWHDRDPMIETISFFLADTRDERRTLERYLVAFVGADPKLRCECEALVRRRDDTQS